MDMYMSPQTSSESEPSRLRRRIIVELTPEELPLLEAAERRHGGKRAAMLAGLRADAEALARHTREAEADEKTARAAAKRADSEATAHAALLAECASLKASLATRTRERDAATAETQRLETNAQAAFREAQDQYAAFFEDIAALEDRLPASLYCARCEEWVPESQWTWRADGEDEIAYHTPCGDHGPGMLSNATWLARRRVA
jgi:chromosome segregation ATPase